VISKLFVVFRGVKVEVLQKGMHAHYCNVVTFFEHCNKMLMVAIAIAFEQRVFRLKQAVIQRYTELFDKPALERNVEKRVHLLAEPLDGVQRNLRLGRFEIGARVRKAAKQSANLHQQRLLVALTHQLVLPLRHLAGLGTLSLAKLGAIRLTVFKQSHYSAQGDAPIALGKFQHILCLQPILPTACQQKNHCFV